jgi:hypothetical protein
MQIFIEQTILDSERTHLYYLSETPYLRMIFPTSENGISIKLLKLLGQNSMRIYF